MPELKLYNTLTRKKEVFQPEDPDKVRMYVCGPTVYDYAHIGNARPVIVFDVLYRLLRHLYGEEHVTYVRNITDVDDKINARALRDYPDLPLNEAIRNVTEKTANQFHDDVRALGCLEPTHEPRATEHIEGMASMIQTLLDKGNAYVAEGEQGREVLFRVSSMAEYGQLSNRKLADQQAGARVAVEAHKENPGDFVLWKESREHEPGWQGTFNGEQIHGRPGWHIECSVMSKFHLGETFDIHGGGLDLIFPHHENEIAQSRCAHGSDCMANYWMHNGYLQVEGKKMSKSEGNFVTIQDLLNTQKFGGRMWLGEVLKFFMLSTHYREPIDWTLSGLQEANDKLKDYALALVSTTAEQEAISRHAVGSPAVLTDEIKNLLCDELNTSEVRTALDKLLAKARKGSEQAQSDLMHNLEALGLIRGHRLFSYIEGIFLGHGKKLAKPHLMKLLDDLRIASANNSEETSASLVEELSDQGVEVELHANGSISYEVSPEADISGLVTQRLKALNDKNFAEADRIRDELASQGIQLKDSKDSETGERVTTWEVKR